MANVSHHIETSQLICNAKQLTGFYIVGTLAVNWLMSDQLLSTLVTCLTIQIYQNLRLNFGDDNVQFLRKTLKYFFIYL